VLQGEPLITMHVNDRSRLDEARAMLEKAVEIGPEAPPSVPLVREVLD
jgi:thymidine phosphorylase